MSLAKPIVPDLYNWPLSDTIVKRYTKNYLFDRLNVTNNNGILSMNDVLMGWLTKIISQIRQVSRQTTVKIGMASNGRTLLPNIDVNYFDNCSFYLCFSFTMSDLDDLSVEELAQRINIEKRQLMTTEYIQSALAFIDKHHRSSPIHLGWQPIGGNDLSFKRKILNSSMECDGLILILPTMTDDEIELRITLQTEHAKLLLSKLV
ncbi:unnamed protein product [Rotaria magnacalcarata]|uniref:Uncharacterized protein n=1 Tax=Rotaria magnacalcarata TaxID=392030 RepID=A0A8S2R7W7_9BILA|nr:unnamed protein product [Rotaria magnacalcarata]CAF4149955.1 unnamed protein product [Rotaria magnacalcarata]CAF4152228.1 unnamed protein product [Rotaria magnacalcarata]